MRANFASNHAGKIGRRRSTKHVGDCPESTVRKPWARCHTFAIDEFRMLWLPWATHRKVWHKMAVWTATQRGWPSKLPFCAILFYASPRATKACETRLLFGELARLLSTDQSSTSRTRKIATNVEWLRESENYA